jgi:hypothetical protein
MKRRDLFWLVPIIFTVHNLEEALTIPRFINDLPTRLPAFMQKMVPVVNYSQFKIALVIVTVLPYLFVLLYQLSDHKRLPSYLLLGTQMVMLINVFSHIGTALLMGSYAPGIVTALLLNLPFSIYLFRRALREAWIGKKGLVALILVGLLLHGPGLWALLQVSAWLAQAF